MAAYAALVSLLNNIEPMMNHPRLSTSLDNKQIQSLGEIVRFLLDLMEKHYSRGGNEEAEEVERRIASAAYEAEDVIESHIVDQIQYGFTEKSPVFLPDLQKIIQDMDSIKEKVIKVKEETELKDEKPNYSIPATWSRSIIIGKTRMVGFDEELIQLMDVLTRQQSKQQEVVSVTGMGGAGKSTLVKNVYENLLIVQHFDIRAWTTISQQYSLREILIDILTCIKNSIRDTVQELGELLHKSLWNRRYLIILDDVWGIETWDEIKFFFPDNENGSRIVLTTRLSSVAIQCSSYCFRMNFLDEDKSWILFCETVFECEDCPSELERVGKKIAKLCKGLPLSIVVIGGLLRRSNMNVEYWNYVAKNIYSVMSSEENEDCSKILSLSYKELDVHLKPCFLYMGIFREDCEIRVSRIIKHWVAEGFIKPNGTQMLEEIAEGYFNDLVDRNLVLVGRFRSNGNIRSFRIHDLIRAVCLKISEKDKFFCATGALDISRERRLIFHDFITNDDDDECQIIDAMESAHLVRSLVCRGFKLPLVFRLLRVLTMASDCSPEAMMHNLNLRFFTFQPLVNSTVTVRLPSSISLIWNLQTLAIHGKCLELVVAPLEIWNLPQLRHVECDKIYLPYFHPNDGEDNFVVLEKLQTVIKAVNMRLSEDVCRRIPNINKLHLIYDDELEGYDDCLFDHLHNLGSLHKLQSLTLLSPVHSSSCKADGRNCMFPGSLKKLSLTNCNFHWDDLTIIGSLPQLEVLKLDHSVEGQNWSPVSGEFLRLKLLSIVDCDLRCWNADSSHFPVLKKLTLERLLHLKEIPLDIGEIPTLEVIILVDIYSESVEISLMEMKEERESLGYEDLQIWRTYSSLQNKLRLAVKISEAALRFLDPSQNMINESQGSLDYL